MQSIKTRKSQFTIRALAALSAAVFLCSQISVFQPRMLAAPSAGVYNLSFTAGSDPTAHQAEFRVR